MSGVYIKDMDIPFTCLTCDFHECAPPIGDFCSRTKRRQFRFKNRPKDCPIIEVPEPHGDLIEKSVIEKAINDACAECEEMCLEFDGLCADCDNCVLSFVKKALTDAPTVIPASPEEEKMK